MGKLQCQEKKQRTGLEAILWGLMVHPTWVVVLQGSQEEEKGQWVVVKVLVPPKIPNSCLGCLTWKCILWILSLLSLHNLCSTAQDLPHQCQHQSHHLILLHISSYLQCQNSLHYHHYHHYHHCHPYHQWSLLRLQHVHQSKFILPCHGQSSIGSTFINKFDYNIHNFLNFQEVDTVRIQMLLEGCEPGHKSSSGFWNGCGKEIWNRHYTVAWVAREGRPLQDSSQRRNHCTS